MGKDKIIDRLRKLHAHYESSKSIGNEAEAMAFLGKFNELMTEHKLSMEEVTVEQRDREEPLGEEYVKPFGKRARIGWVEHLAEYVARAYFCRILVVSGSDTIIFVGRETDRKMCSYVFSKLVNFVKDEADRATRKARYQAWVDAGKPSGGAGPAARGFRESFIAGCVRRIRERLAELRAQEEKTHGNAYSLVVQRSTMEVTKFIEQMPGLSTARSSSMRSGNHAGGYAAGRAAGDRANIAADGLGGGGARSELSKERKQLGSGS